MAAELNRVQDLLRQSREEQQRLKTLLEEAEAEKNLMRNQLNKQAFELSEAQIAIERYLKKIEE